jgi:hypothetical protein
MLINHHHYQPFPRQSTHFFLLCVNCLFRFRCPQTFFLRVFFYRPPPSIDTLSLLRVDCLFFNCRCAQTPRHLLCVERTFSTSLVPSPPAPNLFVVPATSFFTFCVSIARFQLPLRIRFRYQKGHRHLGEVLVTLYSYFGVSSLPAPIPLLFKRSRKLLQASSFVTVL